MANFPPCAISQTGTKTSPVLLQNQHCFHSLGHEAVPGSWSQCFSHSRAAQPPTCPVFKGNKSVCSSEPLRQQLAMISELSCLNSRCISPAHSFPPQPAPSRDLLISCDLPTHKECDFLIPTGHMEQMSLFKGFISNYKQCSVNKFSKTFNYAH